MSSVPAGKRRWKCPDCGGEMLLSMTQLDPIACEACLIKMKGGGSTGSGHRVTDSVAGPLGIWQALPENTKLAIAAGGLVVGLLIGLAVGFVAGKMNAPQTTSPQSSTSRQHGSAPAELEEERPESPGPGHTWVRGSIHKDGTRGKGHWRKDPSYKGDDGPPLKRKVE